MKQWDEFKIEKLLAKFKCTEKEKVFKVKSYWQQKNLMGFAKFMLFLDPWNYVPIPSKLCTSSHSLDPPPSPLFKGGSKF